MGALSMSRTPYPAMNALYRGHRHACPGTPVLSPNGVVEMTGTAATNANT